MELKTVTAQSPDLAALEAINAEAIPAPERNTLSDMLDTGAEIIGIYRNDVPAGFFAVRAFRQIRYLAYFAVRHDLRLQGIGSAAIRALQTQYAGCRLIAEYESPDAVCENNRIRLRRQDFYLRNGFRLTGWHTRYDGTEFTVVCSGKEYDADEFRDFIAYLGTVITDHIPAPFPAYTLRKAVQTDIPELCRLRMEYLTEDLGEMSAEMYAQIEAQLHTYFAAHLGKDCVVFTAALPDGTLAANAILYCMEKPANPFFPNGKDGTVLGVYTMPQYRGNGLATGMMRLLIEEGKARGLSRIALSATADGRPIYERLGFTLAQSHYVSMVLTL